MASIRLDNTTSLFVIDTICTIHHNCRMIGTYLITYTCIHIHIYIHIYIYTYLCLYIYIFIYTYIYIYVIRYVPSLLTDPSPPAQELTLRTQISHVLNLAQEVNLREEIRELLSSAQRVRQRKNSGQGMAWIFRDVDEINIYIYI